ncbi:MAG TPA: SPOR domain-containing protein [Caulobacteraceae bacterium]|nr:SPOR domain-containing protein [Caulobacteraceae bacterium]
MSDPNRGAYSPERPLAFEGYPQRSRGGPAPVTLILSLLVLLGVSGGVFYLYRGGARAPGGPPEPVGAPVGDLKIAAPPQASTPDPAAGLTIYKEDPNTAAGAAPAFTAPPEQPTPRPAEKAPVAVLYPVTPAPSTAAQAQAVAAAASAAPTARAAKTPSIDSLLADAGPAPGKPASAKTVKLAAAESTAAPKAKHAGAVDADAAPKAVAPKTAVSKAADSKAAGDDSAPTKHAGSYVVQIGAFSSQSLADRSWTQVAGIAPGAMAGKGKRVAQVSKNGATLYRTAITGFDSREDAQALCAKLAAAGRTCFVR